MLVVHFKKKINTTFMRNIKKLLKKSIIFWTKFSYKIGCTLKLQTHLIK